MDLISLALSFGQKLSDNFQTINTSRVNGTFIFFVLSTMKSFQTNTSLRFRIRNCLGGVPYFL